MPRDVHNHVLFEASTEVANRVGGIYSVIKSKTPVTVKEYGSRYHLLGPLNPKSAEVEVEEVEPTNKALADTIASMRAQGIHIVYGQWLIDGAPNVILFDTTSAHCFLNEWKADLWSIAGIPAPDHDGETNEAIVFGYLVAWFLGEYATHDTDHAIVGHFHEWLAGVAVPLCRKRKIDVTTVFTTHATLLGRYLCAGATDFYNNLENFDCDAEAGKRGIYHRYCIERAATHSADVFTTVSNITGLEAEHLLKRRPDGITPNGINVVKFSVLHEFQNLHAQYKNKINEFVKGHFYGYYDFDLDNTLYMFIAGRYEYKNKGADMYIEALARLNYRLKESGSKITVVAFIIMPAKTNSYTVETLKGQAVIKSLDDTVKELQESIGKRIFEHCARYSEHGQEIPEIDDLLTKSDKVLLKRRVFALMRDKLPPIVTHNMEDDANDPVLTQIRHVKLFNHSSDRVKVIFHPEFLNSSNPILPLDYDDFVRGCHMGVFPSYYEPWGYTPAECTVMGVPSITTNISGFGGYMEDILERSSDYGVYIVDRRFKSADESVEQLVDYMFDFTKKSRRQRINQRNRTERLSDLLDWRRLGLQYTNARQLALMRGYPDSFEGMVNPFDIPVSENRRGPVSVPGSPSMRAGSMMMTPGDLGSLSEINYALGTEDYAGFKIPGGESDDEEIINPIQNLKIT